MTCHSTIPSRTLGTASCTHRCLPLLPRPSCWPCPAPSPCDSRSTPILPPPATSLLWPHSANPSSSCWSLSWQWWGSLPSFAQGPSLYSLLQTACCFNSCPFRLKLNTARPLRLTYVLPALLHLLKCSPVFQTWIPDIICDTLSDPKLTEGSLFLTQL